MNTKTLIEPLEQKRRQLVSKRNTLIKDIDNEIAVVNNAIKDMVRESSGISDNERTWIIGDVFTTDFFNRHEVCVIQKITGGYISFIRLEAIRGLTTIKKDYCAVELEVELFLKIAKIFLHHSTWYAEYEG